MSDDTEPGLDAAYALDGQDAVKRLYAKWAETYDSGFADASGYTPARRIAAGFVAAGGRGPVLDAGCGTGLVAAHLPDDLEIDGIDISPDMLAVARRKGRYRRLIEADLTQTLPLPDAAYRGLVSAGTFTHGHVGPEAIHELLRVLAPGSVAAIALNTAFADAAGFPGVLDALVVRETITRPTVEEGRIYEGSAPPAGHEDDTGRWVVFTRL
jgi:SAM-dependent methyltransferase